MPDLPETQETARPALNRAYSFDFGECINTDLSFAVDKKLELTGTNAGLDTTVSFSWPVLISPKKLKQNEEVNHSFPSPDQQKQLTLDSGEMSSR